MCCYFEWIFDTDVGFGSEGGRDLLWVCEWQDKLWTCSVYCVLMCVHVEKVDLLLYKVVGLVKISQKCLGAVFSFVVAWMFADAGGGVC